MIDVKYYKFILNIVKFFILLVFCFWGIRFLVEKGIFIVKINFVEIEFFLDLVICDYFSDLELVYEYD